MSGHPPHLPCRRLRPRHPAEHRRPTARRDSCCRRWYASSSPITRSTRPPSGVRASRAGSPAATSRPSSRGRAEPRTLRRSRASWIAASRRRRLRHGQRHPNPRHVRPPAPLPRHQHQHQHQHQPNPLPLRPRHLRPHHHRQLRPHHLRYQPRFRAHRVPMPSVPAHGTSWCRSPTSGVARLSTWFARRRSPLTP